MLRLTTASFMSLFVWWLKDHVDCCPPNMGSCLISFFLAGVRGAAAGLGAGWYSARSWIKWHLGP